MKKITSDALQGLNKAIGITGAGAPETELIDGIVEQSLDVNPIIRRGRTIGIAQGLFRGVFENNHAGADSQVSVINPYNITTGRIAPFPGPVPDLFDLWLLYAMVRQASGTGTLGGVLTLTYGGPSARAFGIDEAGAAVDANFEFPIVHWDALVTVGALEFGVVAGSEEVNPQIGIRIPRTLSAAIRFRTDSSAAAVFVCQIVLGMFPASLGQDGIV